MEIYKDLEKAISFASTPGKKVLLYHTDVDGICSATLFMRFFEGFEPVPLEGPSISDKFYKKITRMKPDVMAVLDIPLDQEWKKLEKIQKELPEMKLLMIDHHFSVKDMNSEKCVHVNPRFNSSVYIPASVLVYRFLEKAGKDVEKLIWIAAMGVIGDYAFRECKDILKECESIYPGTAGGDPQESLVARLSDELLSTAILHGIKGVEKSLKIMNAAESYKDILENKYFAECNRRVDKEKKRLTSEFDKKAKEFPNLGLFIYKIDTRLSIAACISTKLSEKYPDKIIIVTKDSKQMVKISARNQKGDISLNDLMKKAVEGIGSGGGHIKAAGAIVPKKDWKEFERRLVEEIEAQKNL